MSMNDVREHWGDPKGAKEINGIEIWFYDGPGDSTRGVRFDRDGKSSGSATKIGSPAPMEANSVVVRGLGHFVFLGRMQGIANIEHLGHARPEAALVRTFEDAPCKSYPYLYWLALVTAMVIALPGCAD